jgi:hypothetical protein
MPNAGPTRIESEKFAARILGVYRKAEIRLLYVFVARQQEVKSQDSGLHVRYVFFKVTYM